MDFRGELRFASPAAAREAVERAADEDDSVVAPRHFKRRGAAVTLDHECSAPASMYESTVAALHAVARTAVDGAITCRFHLDGVSVDRVYPGGLDLDDFPPKLAAMLRHVLAGDVDALEADRTRVTRDDLPQLARAYASLPSWAARAELVILVCDKPDPSTRDLMLDILSAPVPATGDSIPIAQCFALSQLFEDLRGFCDHQDRDALAALIAERLARLRGEPTKLPREPAPSERPTQAPAKKTAKKPAKRPAGRR